MPTTTAAMKEVFVACLDSNGDGTLLRVLVRPENDDEDGDHVRSILEDAGYSEPVVFFRSSAVIDDFVQEAARFFTLGEDGA